MKSSLATLYRCPHTGTPLQLEATQTNGDEILEGAFHNKQGVTFQITRGIPDLTWPKTLQEEDAQTRQQYEDMAAKYDEYAALPFITYRADEHAIREQMLDKLALKPDDTVLEIGCGTGRGALQLAQRLGANGRLFLQELSPSLLDIAVQKFKNNTLQPDFSIANGSYLPFPDHYFDAAHHFGGINTFADIPRCLAELTRVVKPGGKVVIGDEGLGIWLRNTEMGRIMTNSNPLLMCEPPLQSIPPNTRDVRLEYIMMNAFYVIDFRVTEAPAQPDYHMQIPSARGGSHWTRYYGRLEGVSDEAKHLAEQARLQSGTSMHDWLDRVVRDAAHHELAKKTKG